MGDVAQRSLGTNGDDPKGDEASSSDDSDESPRITKTTKRTRPRWLMPALAVAIAAVLIVSVLIIYYIPSQTDRSLTIENQSVSLSGIEIFKPEDKVSNPNAGDPSYVYLFIGKEAVDLSGPEIRTSECYYLENASITQVEEDVEQHLEDGFQVEVNSHLSYSVGIEDFEDEVDLAVVRLREVDGMIASSFIFVATGSGVAHDVTISAIRDGVREGNSTPIHIECAEEPITAIEATMHLEDVSGGHKGVIDQISPSISWSQVRIDLTERRTGGDLATAVWSPSQSDLDGGTIISQSYLSAIPDSVNVNLTITDILGDGHVSAGDYLTVIAEGQGFDPSCTYTLSFYFGSLQFLEVEF